MTKEGIFHNIKKALPNGRAFCLLLVEEGLVVGRRRLEGLELGVDDLAHFPDPFQVGVDVAFALLVEYPLTIEEYFHDALSARGDSNGGVCAIVPEKFIRHPRGDSVVLSTYAVGNLYLELSFHLVPPSSPKFS
jgi:hypothetical protein